MSTSTDTKIIKFKAVAEGFDKLYKNIAAATADKNVILPENLQRKLVEFQNTIKNIQTLLSKDSGITDGELKQVDKMLISLNSSARGFIDKIASFKLPPEVLKSFQSVNDELDGAQKKLRALLAGQAKFRGFIAEGDNALTNKGYKEAYRQLPAAKKRDLFFKSGKSSISFNNFGELLDEADKIEAQTSNLSKGLQTAILAARTEIKKLIDTFTFEGSDGSKTFIQKFNEQLEESRKRVIEQQREVDDLRKKVQSTPTTPVGERGQDILDTQKMYEQYQDASQKLSDAKKVEADATEDVKKAEYEHNDALQKKNKTLLGAVTSAYAYHTALNFLKRSIREAIQVVTSMDKALTGMAVVTTMSREDTWKLVNSFQSLAKETGKTTTEIADMATKFYQQGKNTQEALELTEAAAKAATIAGIDGAQSIDLLTNAMNGFQMSSSKAMEVSDKFAALAAASATDYEELATALSKVAAQANLAGMSMDFTLGMIAKGIEVTREAPETIGTALKTVISRMRELTDYGKTLEDDMDVNRVATALGNVGIDLMDRTTGQFRDLEVVFAEVGEKWDILNKNQQANIAVAMAGTRQQSRFIAMMQDFDRTLELVDISSTSYGATLAQQAKYMEGMEAKTTLMKNAWEELLLSFVNSDAVIWVIEKTTEGIDFVHKNMGALYGVMGAMVTIGGVRLAQTLRIKQAEFEIAKAENEAKIAEHERAIASSEIEKQKELEAKLQEHRHKVEIAQGKERAKLEELWAEQEKEDILKETVLEQELHLLRLDMIKTEKMASAKSAEEKAEIEAEFNGIINENKNDLKDLERAYAAQQNKVKTANSEYHKAAQEARVAEQELKIETEKVTAALDEKYDTELTLNKLELQKLKLQKSQYKFSLRNVVLLIKDIAQGKINLASIKKQIAARKQSKQAIQEEAAALRDKNQVQNAETSSNIQNAATQNTGNVTKAAGGFKAMAASGLKALGVIVAVASVIASIKWGTEKIDKYNNFIENTTENLEKLQVELYNVKQEHNTIKSLGDEFEGLSKKINTSADEAERLKSIVEEINSTEGTEVIDVNADRMSQLAQIRGLQRSKEMEQQRISDRMKSEIDAGFGNAAYGKSRAVSAGFGATAMANAGIGAGAALVAGGAAITAGASSTIPVVGWIVAGVAAIIASAAGIVAGIAKANEKENAERMEEYRRFITTSQVGQQSLRTVLQNSVSALENFSSTQAKELENIYIAMVADASSEAFSIQDGLQTEFFEQMLENNEKALQEFYNADSFADMYTAIKNMDEVLLKYATESGSTLGALSSAGEDAARAMDKMGVSVNDFINLLNNVKSVMIEFEMDAGSQQKVFASISKILAGEGNAASKMLAIDQVLNDELSVSKSQYDAAISELDELPSEKIKLKGRRNRTLADIQSKKADLDKKGKTSSRFYKKLAAAETEALAEQKANEAIKQAYENQDKIKAELQSAIGQLIFPVTSANDFADALTNITSASERLSKAMNELDTMTTTDKLALIADYPELATDIMRGSLDAASVAESLADKYQSELKKLKRSEENLEAWLQTAHQIFSSPLTIGSGDNAVTIDVSKMTGLNDMSFSEAQKLLTSGVTAQEIVMAQGGDVTDELAIARANNLLGYAQQIIELGIVRQDMGDSYEEYLQRVNKEEHDQFFNKRNQLESEIDLMEKRLPLLGETEQAEELENSILAKKLALLESNEELGIEALEDRLREAAGDNAIFSELLESGVIKITEQGLERNMENYDKLSDKAKENLQTFTSFANDIAEKWAEETSQYYSDLQVVFDSFIDKLTKETEAENELLEERQKAYEEYFDTLDALEKEQERKQSREDIVRQIAALSGGIGGTAKNKIKELQQELNQLNEEEAEARKEEARQAILDDIDNQIEENNEALEKNTAALNALVIAAMGGQDSLSKYYNTTTGKIDWEGILSAYGYSDGGYVTHTGLAYVHGSKTKPEAFISAVDTENIRALLDMFDIALNSSVGSLDDEDRDINETTNNNTSVVVEKIEIHTDKLNNNQDFTSAGNALAKEFAKIIQQRGINVNAKK